MRLTVVNRKSDGCKPPRDASWTQNHVYSSGRPAALLSRKRPPSLRPLAPGAWHHAATARATAMARGWSGASKPVSGPRRHLKLRKFFPAPKPSRGNCKPSRRGRPVPSPIFVAAIIGVENLLRIDLDGTKGPVSFVRQVLRSPSGRGPRVWQTYWVCDQLFPGTRRSGSMQTGNQSQFYIRSVQGPPFSALGGLITTRHCG